MIYETAKKKCEEKIEIFLPFKNHNLGFCVAQSPMHVALGVHVE
jgi:hypothetical protein